MAAPTLPPTAADTGGPGRLTAHWFLPTYGDARGLVSGGHGISAEATGTGREASLGYLAQIARAAEKVTLDGQQVHVEDAQLERVPDPVPPIYFGGSSPAAGDVAARHVDVYLTWGEPPEQVAGKVAWVRGLVAEQGREVRFGIRLHVITRDTADAAWAEAERLLDGIPEGRIEQVQAGLSRSESVGQQRMRALHSGGTSSAADLEVAPNLWAGVGLVRGGAGTALVGSHAEVADRIAEYHDLGITEFVLSGHPHLEDAYWVGEGPLAELGRRGRWVPATGSEAAAALRAPVASVPFAGTS